MERISENLLVLIPQCPPVISVEHLLRLLVVAECGAHDRAQRLRRSMVAWSLEALQEQLASGRAGVSDAPPQPAPAIEDATAAVRDAFCDGLVLLFVDDHRVTRLDETLHVTGETRLTILRRVMLRG